MQTEPQTQRSAQRENHILFPEVKPRRRSTTDTFFLCVLGSKRSPAVRDDDNHGAFKSRWFKEALGGRLALKGLGGGGHTLKVWL